MEECADGSPGLTLVLGGDPAGAACALWLHQLGCPVLLLEKSAQCGGLQQYSPYENLWLPGLSHRKGEEVAFSINAQLFERGIPHRCGVTVQRVTQQAGGGVRLVTDAGAAFTGAILVLATGARFRTGGLRPSDRLAIGPGKPIEAIDVKGRRVAVLGGGDNACDQYLFALNRGASSCKIFARHFRAQKKLRDLVPVEDIQIGAYSVDQDFMTVNATPFDVISVQYGYEPVVPDGLEDLQRNAEGFVLADHWGQTNIEGIYAVGEVAQTFHPCVATSFAHGIQAAKAIQRRLGL